MKQRMTTQILFPLPLQVLKIDPGLGVRKSQHKTLLLLRELPQTGEKALDRKVCTEVEAAKAKVTTVLYLCP